MRCVALLFLTLSCLSAYAGEPFGLPSTVSNRHVYDSANRLSNQEEAVIQKELKAYYKKTSNVILVVTIPSLQGTEFPTLHAWNVHLFDTWKPGSAKKNNGVIITIVGTIAPYKIWITPGRGLEGALPDAIANRIAEDDVDTVLNSPNGYFLGVKLAIERLQQVIGDEFTKDTAEQNQPVRDENMELAQVLFVIVLMVLAVFLFVWLLKMAWRTRMTIPDSTDPWDLPEERTHSARMEPSSDHHTTHRGRSEDVSQRDVYIPISLPSRDDEEEDTRQDDTSVTQDEPDSAPDDSYRFDTDGETGGAGAGTE
jgi:uncharacterized membrane protein YgcG